MGTYYWAPGAANFGLASSWTPSGGPPTASDTANINVAASIYGTGAAQILNIDSTGVAVSGPLTTTIAQTRIGATAAGGVAVGSDWNLENGALNLGAAYSGALTIGAGGDVTNVFGLTLGAVSGAQGTLTIENGGQLSDNANDSAKWDLIGYAAGSSGVATVEGSGSNWTSTGKINVGYLGQGELTVSDGGSVDALNLIIGSNSSGPVSGGGSGTATIESGGSVTTTGPWDEIGAYQGATGALTVTGPGSTWASGGAIQIGVGGDGSLTISDGAGVIAVDDFEVGQQGGSTTNDGSSGTLLIESGGTAVTGGHANGGSFYDTVGINAAGPTSTATVTGTGSSWTMNANLNINATGAVYAADGGTITVADDIDMVAGSLLSVDPTSAVTDNVSAAEAGYLVLGPDSAGRATLSGDGTVDANIIDNGIIFATQGTLTLNGSISGSYKLKLGNQATLALNGGPVSNALGVYFLGWYGDLEIGDASGFSDSINDFVAGDIIDLTNVKFTSSSYTYTPPSYRNGPSDLQIVEDGVTYNLNVNNDEAFSGAGLIVTADPSGQGTEIAFASTPASPFNPWGAALSNFFSTASGPVNGEDWASSNVTNGGDPIWIDTETPAGSYAPGAAGAYTIVLTTQDFLGDQQQLVTVATDANIVDPFGSSASSIGNLAGATIFNSTSTTASGAVLYWQNSATPGDYALEFAPIATTDPTGPSSEGSTVLSGSPLTLLSAVADPTSWTYESGDSTSLVVSYTTAASATTENIWFQAFTNTGVATSPDVEVAANVADSTQYSINYSNGTYSYDYASVAGSATGLYERTFNAATGALGAATEILVLPSFSSISGATQRPALSSGSSLQFVEGVVNGQAVIQAFMNSDPTPTASFNLSSAGDQFATADVEDINDNNLDDTVLIYTDDNQVHLELLNQNGVQIGSDFIVPGLTSFDRIQTLTGVPGTDNYPDTRVEIDTTVADPSGGTQVEGVIYDTVGAPYAYTLNGTDSNLGNGGNGEYSGTPFNDTISDAPGNYTVNGGGGNDMFIVDYDASQVQLSENSAGDVIVTTPSGVATLEDFSNIYFNDAKVGINGNTLTETNNEGARTIYKFNIADQSYSGYEQLYNEGVHSGTDYFYTNVTGQPYSSYQYDYSASNALIGSTFNYTGIAAQTYTGEEVDYNGEGLLTSAAFTGVTGAPYSAYKYNYVGGVFSGSQFTYTTVPAGATYAYYETDYDQANNYIGEQFFFTNIKGQSYTGEEESFDASGALSSVLLTGIAGQAYSSQELDYSDGTYVGDQTYYTGITGQSYTSEEVDASAANQLEKVVYSGMKSTPYSSVEQDYSGGALADVIYDFTNVKGQPYDAYQVEDTAGGAALQETLDLNSGGHDLIALASGQTLASLGADTMTGDGSATFVLNAVYGADTIANLTNSDIVSMPDSEFASFAALSAAASFGGGAAVITAADGDTLTLKGVATSAQLQSLSGDFTFHA